MNGRARDLSRRYESAKQRIQSLGSLRELVALPPARDIRPRQWRAIQAQLTAVEERLQARLNAAGRAHLPYAHELGPRRKLNALLGELEIELSTAFSFFDTYMDVLTQRHAPEMGLLLAGCDALAWDGIRRDHPALAIVEPPLVFCDRGFGASTLREGVRLRHGIPNPMPLVQIPYSRLKEKCNLTSVLHEVGHEAMVRLGLVKVLPEAFRAALDRESAPAVVRDYVALWSSEIGPDFWTFCASGVAAAAGIKEILALPPDAVFRVPGMDPHPPPYLRVLLSFDWCRQTWGRGMWDQWEVEWQELYPEASAPAPSRRLIEMTRAYLPLITRTLMRTRFRVLNGRAIPDLFDLPALAPARLETTRAAVGSPDFDSLPPSAQLAVFRLTYERGRIGAERLDRVMTHWLMHLAASAGVASDRNAHTREALAHVRPAVAVTRQPAGSGAARS